MTLKRSPNVAMVEAIDIGDLKNVHPLDKADLADRAVLAARRLAYGENVVASGPLYDSFTVEKAKIHVKFVAADGGLKVGLPPAAELALFPQQLSATVNGFVVCGADMNFVPATAVIDGPDTVTVWSDSVTAPVAARYAWGTTLGNLYNGADLPASPFRTDPSTPALPVKPPPKPKPATTAHPAVTAANGNPQAIPSAPVPGK